MIDGPAVERVSQLVLCTAACTCVPPPLIHSAETAESARTRPPTDLIRPSFGEQRTAAE